MNNGIQFAISSNKDIPRPLRTLIVDDSDLFLTSLNRLLNVQGGIEVVGTAPNGREALVVANKLHPDLVLMDLHMPVMDGLQATQLLHQQVPHSRIIIMTVDESGFLLTICRDHGAHGFISKHNMVKSLMTEIRRVFY